MRSGVFLLLALFATPAAAQEGEGTLYAAVLENKRYVVGARNAPSGLHRFEGDTTWTHLGWKNVRANGISYVRPQPDTLFMAAGNGAFRSFDAGKSWRTTSGWQITEVQDIAVDVFEPQYVYLATAYGVWRTENLGRSWRESTGQVSPTFTQTITADAARAGRAIVGGEGGLFETTDYGRSWTRVGRAYTDVRDVQQCTAEHDLWLAGTGRGVLISRDGGSTWTSGALDGEVIYAVAADPANPRRLAAAGFETGIFLSQDGGREWERVSPGLTVLALVFDAGGSGRLWAGSAGGGVFRVDAGAGDAVYAGLEGATVRDLVFVHDEE